MFELELDSTTTAKLKVVGCGGAGGNAINRMIGAGLRGVEFIAANTDIQALQQSLAPHRIQLGASATRGQSLLQKSAATPFAATFHQDHMSPRYTKQLWHRQ